MIKKQLHRWNRLLSLISRGFQPSVGAYLGDTVIETNSTRLSDAGNEWDSYKKRIIDELQHHSSSFLRQPMISRTVHPNEQNLADCYLNELARNDFAQQSILPRLHDIPAGDPYLSEKFPLASPVSIQHAWYMSLMQAHLGILLFDQKISHVIEFGGGYGNFCRLLYTFGYQNEYTIIDFQEMHTLQKHFLRQVHQEKISSGKIRFKELAYLLNEPIDEGPTLFIATFSLNETPINLRKKVEENLSKFDYLFFAYNREFGGVDNVKYFNNLKQRLSNQFHFTTIKDSYRPAWFLLGQKLLTKKNADLL